MASAEIKNFETQDEVLVLRRTLQPGWRWADHVVGDEPVEAVDWGGAHVWGRASQ